jgi:5-oxoprolinase (ATP-hydrolysing)
LSGSPHAAADPAIRGIRVLLARHAATDAAVESIRLGTTVATNALLERRGEPTLLLTTRGFADALRIGQQHRPDIFALEIRRPAPLHAAVAEVGGRCSAQGEELEPLDEAGIRAALQAARAQGLASVAIAFLNSHVNPAHEQRAATLARAAGFAEVVVSHQAVAMAGFIARADTALADAYLSPPLARYVDAFRAAVAREFGAARLQFMQSNGGLVDADAFRGVPALLSGPAGGVLATAASAALAGGSELLGLDMGGTSTDLCLLRADELPRRFDAEIDGVRVRAPMMDLHTLAAGGGSIVRVADGRLQVGPVSAGAVPGPACYRLGGPPTLTDCNLLLGRLQPTAFPPVFGPHGDLPPDPDAARARLLELAAALAAETAAASPPAAESVAAAAVEVAVEATARAILQLALRAGADPQAATLVCFGGAGGQHACAVADAIGLRQVLLPALAGVFSAQGIGLARRRSLQRRGCERPLAEAAALAPILLELEVAACADLARHGVARVDLDLRCVAQLRAADAETLIEVPWASEPVMLAGFAAGYRRLFGIAPAPDTEVVVAALLAEAVERGGPPDAGPDAAARSRAPAAAPAVARGPRQVRVWLGGSDDGRFGEVELLERESLAAGELRAGPLLVVDPGATHWIAPGWNCQLLADRSLRLLRETAAATTTVRRGSATADSRPDPQRLEIIAGVFMHVAEQMGAVLQQTASSVNIRERLDFSCALFDADGALVANAPHMPVHLGSMGASVQAVRERYGGELRPGDAYLLNSPFHGGTHLPDLTVVSPVFDPRGERLQCWVASRAHHADVGGRTPGSMPPDSCRIEEEGALIEPLRVVRDGRLDEARVRALLAAQRWPARDPQRNLADLRAQLAANARGAEEFRRATARHGEAVLRAYLGHVQDNAERCLRERIRRLREGEFSYELDSGARIAVRVTIDAGTGSACVDFDGTSAQQADNFNAPRAVTTAAVLYVFRTLLAEPIPLNAGCLRPLDIRIPAGSMLDPLPPAAVVAGNVETSQSIVDALYGALGVQAAAQGTMNNLTFGDAQRQYYETIGGGAGAGAGYAGASGVQTHMTNSRLTDPEVLEARFPVLLREFALRPGSGGTGRWRGGDGLRRVIEFRAAMTVAILSNHRRVAPFGLAGGSPAQPGVNRLRRRDGRVEPLAARASAAVQPGDAIEIETPGGGGYGTP